MADTLYEITSGFYDSIDQDRLYSADQMNMPYKRLISEGVFAQPDGTASTDFQVLTISGMNVKVCAGNAILGEKWVEMEADQAVTISGNTSVNPRIDSIILRVDRNSAVRAASVVYRAGTAASSPSAPDLDTSSNVYEFRLADIKVASGASSISQSVVTDQRGSAECPWITSLIWQMDTSTLFEQWKDAYQAAYDAQEAQWEEFFNQLTEELTLQTSVVAESGSYTTTGSTSSILITDFGISDYERDTCELAVFINGLYAISGDKWTLSYDSSDPTTAAIVFDTALSAGQSVYIVVLKSIITGNATTLLTELSSLETRVNTLETQVDSIQDVLDGDRATISLNFAGATASAKFYRRGNVVTGHIVLSNTSKFLSATGADTIGTLPSGFRPIDVIYSPLSIRSIGTWATASYYHCYCCIGTNGELKIYGNASEIQNCQYLNGTITFVVED